MLPAMALIARFSIRNIADFDMFLRLKLYQSGLFSRSSRLQRIHGSALLGQGRHITPSSCGFDRRAHQCEHGSPIKATGDAKLGFCGDSAKKRGMKGEYFHVTSKGTSGDASVLSDARSSRLPKRGEKGFNLTPTWSAIEAAMGVPEPARCWGLLFKPDQFHEVYSSGFKCVCQNPHSARDSLVKREPQVGSGSSRRRQWCAH